MTKFELSRTKIDNQLRHKFGEINLIKIDNHTRHKLGEIKNYISGISTSLRYIRIQTSLDEGIIHGNELGAGRNANMGNFNPFL